MMYRPPALTETDVHRPARRPLTLRGFLGTVAIYLGLLALLSPSPALALVAAGGLVFAAR